MTAKRPYRMRKRSESQAETRQRIVEAAMHLHEEVGPRATSISAVAERAGVQRLTVYRHFTDEAAIFQACTSHWLALHPPPDPHGWQGIEDGEARARAAFEAFHDYYASTARMWSNAHRDEPDVPALQAPMQAFRLYLDDVAGDLVAPFGARGTVKRMLAATLRHALSFTTWESLQSRGLSKKESVALLARWVACLRS